MYFVLTSTRFELSQSPDSYKPLENTKELERKILIWYNELARAMIVDFLVFVTTKFTCTKFG